MAYNANQARDERGQWAAGGHAGEAEHRQPKAGAPSGRYPVKPAAGVKRSVATKTGTDVLRLDDRTGRFVFVATNKRRAVAESIARGQRFDGNFARVR